MTDSTTAQRFRAAVEKRDLAALDDLFTEDVRFYSPVKFVPFEGKAMVVGLLGVLLGIFEDFRYVGEFDGRAETSRTAPKPRRRSCSSAPPCTARRSTASTCCTSTRPAGSRSSP